MNKLISCRYNMDTNRVEARFADGFKSRRRVFPPVHNQSANLYAQ